MSMAQSMDCFHADEFCPYGKKNCLFSHGPDDQPPPKAKKKAATRPNNRT